MWTRRPARHKGLWRWTELVLDASNMSPSQHCCQSCLFCICTRYALTADTLRAVVLQLVLSQGIWHGLSLSGLANTNVWCSHYSCQVFDTSARQSYIHFKLNALPQISARFFCLSSWLNSDEFHNFCSRLLRCFWVLGLNTDHKLLCPGRPGVLALRAVFLNWAKRTQNRAFNLSIDFLWEFFFNMSCIDWRKIGNRKNWWRMLEKEFGVSF